MNPVAEDILMHYGVKRRSGRYPWGSGENPYQHSGDFLARIETLKKNGWEETAENIQKEFGLSTTDYRAAKAVAKHERHALLADRARSMRDDGKTLQEIANTLGYLKLGGEVGAETFGYDRVFNQMFYRSAEWRRVRNQIILRDNCCDLGAQEHPILGERIVIHHLNPILLRDIREATPYLLEPEYLVTTVHETHNAIHYGSADLLRRAPAERRAGDTCPWRKQKS